jgi:hypothetical protein
MRKSAAFCSESAGFLQKMDPSGGTMNSTVCGIRQNWTIFSMKTLSVILSFSPLITVHWSTEVDSAL